MRTILLLALLVIMPISAIGEESKEFAGRFLASWFSEDESLYKSLWHSSMKNCKNEIWNRKSGVLPEAYEFDITEDVEQTIRLNRAALRSVGFEVVSYTAEPTHEISITWEETNEFPEGHPCHSTVTPMILSELVRENDGGLQRSVCQPNRLRLLKNGLHWVDKLVNNAKPK